MIVPEPLRDRLRHDSVMWRRALLAGVRHGPDAWVRFSPPVFGVLFGAALGPQRRAVRRNLRRIRGARGALQEALDVAATFSSYATCLTEALVVGTGRDPLEPAAVTGAEHFLQAIAAGRGAVVVTAHTGGWQVAGHLLRQVRQVDVVVVMQRERDDEARRIQDDARENMGMRVLHAGGDPLAALPLLGHLRRGGVVATQIDRVPDGMRARGVELFGEPWPFPSGPLELAAMAGAPLLPVFTRRVGRLRYEVFVGRARTLPRRPDAAALDRAAQGVASEMERFVRDHPTQWFHFVG